ncbi:MAG: hypothetical protein WBD20_01445 [Pirellulaceae bacterium]
MTQLSLFDSPIASTSSNTSPSIVAVETATYSVGVPAAKTETPGPQRPANRRRRRKGAATPLVSQDDNVEGVQRMGDLARLVIRRYELTVQRNLQRNAAMAAKRRQVAK